MVAIEVRPQDYEEEEIPKRRPRLSRLQSFLAEFTGGKELDLLGGYEDDECRERLLSDLVNTGVVATLITGFSYDSWVTMVAPPQTPTQILKDVVTFATIQTAMLSAISATFLYKKVSACNGRQAKEFLLRYRFYLMCPHCMFLLGATLFLVMVVLFGYMSTNKLALRLTYIAMGLGCPVLIGAFFLASSRIEVRYSSSSPVV